MVTSSTTPHDLGTVLGVWAHPDDETYVSGGIMARAVRDGSSVTCVTATRGELGSPDEQRWPPGPPLAAIRTRELEAALAELGVHDHVWLDYPDGGCSEVDDGEAIERVCAVMERVRPDTVLTFGPTGGTGHGDHISAWRWTTAAVQRMGGGVRLCYETSTPEWLESFRPELDSLGVFLGNEPPSTPADDLSIHLLLDEDLLDLKVRAILQQASQVEPMVAGLGMERFRQIMTEEMFAPAGL
jgi:LmbE family N-acetylglucosaminyl deacetylase